ncbi:MAG: zinc-ribbon domain-containing protein, partial [Nitrospinota bacterium]
MIICCPKCGTQYEIEDSLISAKGRKARCYKCESIFSVKLRERESIKQGAASSSGEPSSWESETEGSKEPVAESGSDISDGSIDQIVSEQVVTSSEEELQNPDFSGSSPELEEPAPEKRSSLQEKTHSLSEEGEAFSGQTLVDNLEIRKPPNTPESGLSGPSEAADIENLFSEIEDLPENFGETPGETVLENGSDELDELLGEISEVPQVSKSGIILEEDLD